MNAPVRIFEAKTAVRTSVPLLVGLMGCSGSGKTFSALRLATGIQTVTGGKIYCVDTEARRMLHYADQFDFEHVQFDAPFGSLDYLTAIRFCVDKGAKVIVVDSMSHEHSGVGGMIEAQEQELDRLAGSDWSKRERCKMLAWQKPKAARRRLIDGLLQMNANFVFCFRAKETVKPIKTNGKTEIVPMGFMPIAGDEFLFEQTVNCLLLPKSNGVPTWQSENVGERLMMKLPQQFRELFAESRPLDEDMGAALARWASGSTVSPATQESSAKNPAPTALETQASTAQVGAGMTWDEYVERWNGMLDEDSASPAMLGKAWNSAEHKQMRVDMQPTAEQVKTLMDTVVARINALKGAAA